ETEPGTPSLRVYATEGQVGLAAGGAEETLSGPGSIAFHAPKKFDPKSDDALPGWVTEPGPSPVEQQLGKQFAAFFKGNLSVRTALYTAPADAQKEIKQLAIAASTGLDDLEPAVVALSAKDDPFARRAGLRVLRDYMGRGPAQSKALRKMLEQVDGPEN